MAIFLNKLKWVVLPLVVVSVLFFWWCWQQPTSTVYIVRHAEKGINPPQDPPLTAAGQVRAEALNHVLKDAGVQVVIASQFQRTQQTVHPTANELGLVVKVIDAGHFDEIAQQAMASVGSVSLICGHSNTVPDIIEALGGDAMADIEEDQFDNLFVVTKRKWHGTQVLPLKYGEIN